MRLLYLLLYASFVLFDVGLEGECSLLKFVFLKFEEGFLFLFNQEVLLHFVNSLLEVNLVVLDLLDSFGHCQLFIFHTVLMALVEVTLLAQFVPGALGLLGLDLSLGEFFSHFFNFETQSGVLVSNVGN